MWKLMVLACSSIWLMTSQSRDISVAMEAIHHGITVRKDFVEFEFVRDADTSPETYKQSQRCKWNNACICRDERYYTNSTYKLMVNCTQAGLLDLPEDIPNTTTVLSLDNNKIKSIKSGAFMELIYLKYLDISNNHLNKLEAGLFEGLDNLHTLEISGNKIRYNSIAIPHDIFKPLNKRVRLNLHQHLDGISNDEEYPAIALANLKQLHQLLIDGLQAKDFGNTFASMTKLTILELSSRCGRCNLSTVSVNMFRNLKSVTNFKLSNCNIKHVEAGSFKEMKSLTKLDMSYNEQMHFETLPNITFGLQTQHLKELKLSKIHETFGDCTRLEKKHFLYLKNMNIDAMFLDANRGK